MSCSVLPQAYTDECESLSGPRRSVYGHAYAYAGLYGHAYAGLCNLFGHGHVRAWRCGVTVAILHSPSLTACMQCSSVAVMI